MEYPNTLPPTNVTASQYERLELFRAAISQSDGKVVTQSEIIRRALDRARKQGLQVSKGNSQYGKLTRRVTTTMVTPEQYNFVQSLSVANMVTKQEVVRAALASYLEVQA